MKKNNIFLLTLLFIVTIFAACDDEGVMPDLSVVATPATVVVGEEVSFKIAGDAETYVIYTGDNGHKFANSYLAVTAGMDLDQEEVVLTADSLVSLTPWLIGNIESYNNTEGSKPVNADSVLAGLSKMVDKVYINKETPKYEITQLMPNMYQVAVSIVDIYFENHSVLLAPEEGFSTGVAISRYDLEYTYTYSAPGTYVATVIATNVSTKNYSGSGYTNDRTASADEYNFNRQIKEVTITVTETNGD